MANNPGLLICLLIIIFSVALSVIVYVQVGTIRECVLYHSNKDNNDVGGQIVKFTKSAVLTDNQNLDLDTRPKERKKYHCGFFDQLLIFLTSIVELISIILLLYCCVIPHVVTIHKNCKARHKQKIKERENALIKVKPVKIKPNISLEKVRQYLKPVDKTNQPVLEGIIKALFYDGWKNHVTECDTNEKESSNSNVEIQQIYQIHNDALLDRYESAHKYVTTHYELPEELTEKPIFTNQLHKYPVSTVNTEKHDTTKQPLIPKMTTPYRNLETSEAYLFHGASRAAICDIIRSGFDIHKSKRGSQGRRPGIYLAERSQRADQYTDTDTTKDGNESNRLMLVVRTSMGRTLRHVAGTEQTDWDTLVGGKDKRFREFVKKDTSQLYPEFLIVYDRL